MQKKLLSFLLITAITYSCSKGLSQKDNENKLTASNDKVLDEAKAGSKKSAKNKQNKQNKQNEIARKVIYFETDSFALNQESEELLKNQISLIKSESKIVISTEGHCDERGSGLYNKKLGKKRAEEVKKFLVKSGIKSAKISTISYGKNKPVDLGHDESAWSKNRRVEIVLFN
jgi:peptidoglycan-associated lipoprotein